MHFNAGQFYIPKKKWISSPDSYCLRVKDNFQEYFTSGFYESIGEGMVILEIMGERNYLGLIGKLSLQDYRQGKILAHEKTLPASHQSAMDRVIQRKAMIKPTLLTYDPHPEIGMLLTEYISKHKPVLILDFDHHREKRKYWLIPKGTPEEMRLVNLFDTQVNQLYIADGHHRFAAADWLNKNESFPDSILSSLFSFDQLEIHDYNRIVEKPPQLSVANLIARMSKYLNIRPIRQAQKPKTKHELTMKLGGEWYRLHWRNKWMQKYKKESPFDAYLLNEVVLKRIFGIEDVRVDSRVNYISGIYGLEQVEANMNEQKVAFLLYPINIKNLTAALDHQEVLPPKSTWFEPRMKNGIVVEPLLNYLL